MKPQNVLCKYVMAVSELFPKEAYTCTHEQKNLSLACT